MKIDEIKKGLREIKSFIISELKNEDSNWRKSNSKIEEKIIYSSKWLDISVLKNGEVEIYLSGTSSQYVRTQYNIKDIGLSKMRFNWLIKYVEKFITRKEEREKMENIVSNWNNFLDK